LAQLFKKVLGIRRQAVTSRFGQCFLVDPVSYFGWELADHGVYEPALSNVIQGLLRPGDVFVDIGANEGSSLRT